MKKKSLRLKDLMELESRVLLVLEKEKFTTSFDDYIHTEQFAKKIGEITNLYFLLMQEYDAHLIDKELSKEERKELLTDFNQKTLDSDVSIYLDNYVEESIIESFLSNYSKEA